MAASDVSSPSKKHILRWIAIVLVAILLIIGIIFLIRGIVKKSSSSVLPREQLQEIGTFLDENPPSPVTAEQAATITNTLNKSVELDDADMQALNNFLKK
jgi:flagellar basal body-associated protein FliL